MIKRSKTNVTRVHANMVILNAQTTSVVGSYIIYRFIDLYFNRSLYLHVLLC